jgi:Zn-dependent protease with chaperone function/uncharacterized tellurite resistance protein B-like protein
MNFFEHQDRARRNTRYLVLLLVAAVFSLIVITTLLFAMLAYWGQDHYGQAPLSHWQGILHALNPSTFLWISLGISCVVLFGSFFRFVQLRGGGKAVAEAMGGRLLSGNTSDLDERKILNVVEEMAIASGTAVPPVYLIEEQSINAFAAGYHPQDAVIGVTRGCIENLSRDELQGVVAHEFSHVFHGDMRINMRLVSLLYGILVIGLIGEFLIRIAGNRGARRSSKDSSPVAILALGLGLLVIGYTGIFFGNLIKAAVSRQREFLADASAVQFTRNPAGIAGALKKIGGNTYGSQLRNEHAAEFSHMYFGQGVKSFLTLMATHPPLEDRIKRIQPNWDGEFSQSVYKRSEASESAEMSGLASAFSDGKAINAIGAHLDINQTLDKLAQPNTKQVDYARARLAEIPEILKFAVHESFSARAVVFGLLLDANENIAQRQMALISERLEGNEFDQLHSVIIASSRLAAKLRLPVLELCLPALKQLSKAQHKDFLQCLNALITADKRISLMEWALYRIVLHNTSASLPTARSYNLKHLQDECGVLLSILAYAGAETEADAKIAFARAASELNFSSLALLARNRVQLAQLDKALEKLNGVKPLQKPQLLKAMSQCVLHDERVTIVEAELFRAIADCLDCPVPPLILENIR